MPFGICSAPEVFQCCMHEVIEGLAGVEVITDDFVIVGCSDTTQGAIEDHDKNSTVLQQRCEERGLKLNFDKMKLWMQKVATIYWTCCECLLGLVALAQHTSASSCPICQI